MTAILIRIIGTIHGLFAVWILLSLPAIFSSGVLSEVSIAQTTIKLTSTAIGIAMLLLCMWASWRLNQNAFIYAWVALGVFILAAFSDTVALRGLSGLFDLMPAFYIAIFIRAIAAGVLTVLLLNLPSRAVGG